MSRMKTIYDFGVFLQRKRALVLAPLIVVLVLLAIFILLAEIPVLTPFIYAIF